MLAAPTRSTNMALSFSDLMFEPVLLPHPPLSEVPVQSPQVSPVAATE